ncbi:MAG TPA: nuclear transport factor 2 family protein [Pyrinomonadaceae bacterium]|jgi:ketosteroid isomerase-like protein|nr:nuclear transport factor 2 family protein [Pyrinomonadaceae bacterium]
MSHPNEQALRSAYEAFVRGDLDGYLGFCAEEITFHVPGRGQVAGDYTRAEFKHPFISKVFELTGGTFRETITDVVANDRRGVVLARHEFERGGRAYAYDTAHVYKIRDGKLAEFVEYPADLYAFDEAWE